MKRRKIEITFDQFKKEKKNVFHWKSLNAFISSCLLSNLSYVYILRQIARQKQQILMPSLLYYWWIFAAIEDFSGNFDSLSKHTNWMESFFPLLVTIIDCHVRARYVVYWQMSCGQELPDGREKEHNQLRKNSCSLHCYKNRQRRAFLHLIWIT